MIEDGILLINKPAGLTSFGVVARVRRILTDKKHQQHRERGWCHQPTLATTSCKCKVKVGRTGTLDPFATGLMIIVVGKECRNAQAYSKQDKTYQATIKLGATSTTGDPEGEISHTEVNTPPADQAVQTVLQQFVGEIEQQPPKFSAIKINGRRAYDLARKGDEFEMPKRLVTIRSLKLIKYDFPDVEIETLVSSGTYIRTLACDIGDRLNVGAYCGQLCRTTIGDYRLSDAQTLDDFMKS